MLEFEPIEVKLVTSNKKGATQGVRYGDPSSTPSGILKNKIPLERLGVLSSGTESESTSSGESLSHGDSDGFDFAQLMGVEEETKIFPFMSAIWKNINAKLGYPEDFIKQRIRGSVTIQFMIDQRGVFSGNFMKVESDNDFLKVYIMAILIHSLSSPVHKNFRPTEQKKTLPMAVVTQFDFDLIGIGENPAPKKISQFKNILVFERRAYVEPITNEYIERFFTRYLPPIIPIPGGFYIDFIRAYQFFSSIGKPDPDQKREQRLLNTKEQLEQIVKNNKNRPVP